MKITSILFDMDGVLVDSEEAIRICCIEALKSFGISAKHEDFFEFTGMGEDRFIGGVAEKYGKEYQFEMKDLAYQYYAERASQLIIVYAGIKELIYTLKEKGLKIAVASAADRVKVAINLGCISLSESDFNAVITGSEVKNKKPDPEIYLTAAQKIGSNPSDCLVIEDAVSGLTAAKAAGMQSIGVTSSFDEQTLKNAGASFVISHTPDILKFI
jgi:beta-phosphoglucomutase